MRTQANEGTCPDCGAEVLWLRIDTGLFGALRAFNRDAESRYVLSATGAQLVEVHTDHFDTCPVRASNRALHTTRHDAGEVTTP